MRYANYGKGVIFWQSDADAAAFVNGYTDIVSADIYWYTDPTSAPGRKGPTFGAPGSAAPQTTAWPWTGCTRSTPPTARGNRSTPSSSRPPVQSDDRANHRQPDRPAR